MNANSAGQKGPFKTALLPCVEHFSNYTTNKPLSCPFLHAVISPIRYQLDKENVLDSLALPLPCGHTSGSLFTVLSPSTCHLSYGAACQCTLLALGALIPSSIMKPATHISYNPPPGNNIILLRAVVLLRTTGAARVNIRLQWYVGQLPNRTAALLIYLLWLVFF